MAENDKKNTNSDVTIESQPETATKAKTGFVHTTAFKCVIVLLIIVVVCAVFLTIFNALFEVTDQERTDRAAKKIYGEKVTTQEEVVDTSVDVGNASINLVYTIKEYPNDYLINVTGKNGYSGGTVTCYVVVTVESGEISIGNISISENDGQSFISNIKTSYLEGFSDIYGVETSSTDEYYMLYSAADGFYVNGSTHLTTGATNSMRAICNAVNGAVSYVEQVYLHMAGESSHYSDAYVYTASINTKKTSHVVNGSDVTYTIVTDIDSFANAFTVEITVGEGGTITAYSIISSGSTNGYDSTMMSTETFIGLGENDILSLLNLSEGTISNDSRINTGSSLSNYLCAYAALFATANYEQALADGDVGVESSGDFDYTDFEYTEYIDTDETTYSIDGTTVSYHVVTTTYESAHPFTVDIVVDGTQTIVSLKIVVDGSNTAWSDEKKEALEEIYVGLSLSDVEACFDTSGNTKEVGSENSNGEGWMGIWSDSLVGKEETSIYNGSSESCYLVAQAALFALANYNNVMGYDGFDYDYSGFEYVDYIDADRTSHTVVGTTVTYTVVTGTYANANPFTVEITVELNAGKPTITDYVIVVDGSNTAWSDGQIASVQAKFIGMTLEDVQKGMLVENGEYIISSGIASSALYNGSSESNTLCARAALFALANYDKAVHTGYDGFKDAEYINLTETTYEVIGDEVTFTIVTGTFEHAHPFTVEVTVGKGADDDGNEIIYIVSLSVLVDGSNTKWTAEQIEALEAQYEGITYNEITGCFKTEGGTDTQGEEASLGIWSGTLDTDNSIYNGSSESCFLVAQAALFALANYETIIGYYAGYSDADYINLTETTYEVIGDEVTFTIVTGTFEHAHPFTVEVTVGKGTANGGDEIIYIVSLSVLVDGSNTKWTAEQIEALEAQYEGITYNEITGCFKTENDTDTQGEEASLGIWSGTLDTENSIYNGSSESCFLVAQAALFALANYETIIGYYAGYSDANYINLTETTFEVIGNEVTFTIVTGTFEHAHPFTVEVTVGQKKNSDGDDITYIVSLSVLVDGSNTKWTAEQIEALEAQYEGITYEEIMGSFKTEGGSDTSGEEASLGIWSGDLDSNNSIYNGSSESCYLVAQAALFALANYDAAVATVSEKYSGFTNTNYINLTETSWVLNEDYTVTYTVVTGSAYHAHPFTVEITVGYNDSTPTILSLSVIVDGSNTKWTYGEKYLLGQNYVGVTAEDINNSFKGDGDSDTAGEEASVGIWKGTLDTETSIYNGSSESCFLVAQAALFALANFATIIGQQS